jgi:hypothetical protein
MNACEKCPYASLKKKFDEGKISFEKEDGSRNDFVYVAFSIAMKRFDLSKLNKDCPLGENGCPAIYRREAEKLKN